MARARGANAVMALAFETTYGAAPGSGYAKLPFVTANLGEEQGLIASDLLGQGREAGAPSLDVINNDGDIVVPVDLRAFGYWLKLLFGPAASDTQGAAATGSVVFTAQPANNATITVNGTVFTFVSGTPASAVQIKIGATLAATLANAVYALNASADANVTPASYGLDLTGTTITVTHDTIGTGGNSFTLAASSSPASNATASGGTLAGGATSGAYNHVFTSGAANLPSATVEIGLPDVPSFGQNFGVTANTLAIQLQRSGHLNATIGLVAQGENLLTATGAGSPTEIVLERFAQFRGQIERDGVPLGEVVSGRLNFSNGLDKVEVIRADGRIAGADAGVLSANVEVVTRFSTVDLLDLAKNNTPVDMVFGWAIGAGKSLRFRLPNVFLPKPRRPITGPGGIQVTFGGQGAKHATIGKTIIATLVNDVASY